MHQFMKNAQNTSHPISSQNSTSTWVCDQCTYENMMGRSVCIICERPRSPVPIQPSSVNTQWTCSHCNYLNSHQVDSCQCCNKYKPVTLESATAQQQPQSRSPLLMSSMSTPNVPTLSGHDDDDDDCDEDDDDDVIEHIMVTPGPFTRGGPDGYNIRWICSQCTFTNLNNLTKCHLCDAPRFVSMTVGTIGGDIILDLDEDDFYDDDYKNHITMGGMTMGGITMGGTTRGLYIDEDDDDDHVVDEDDMKLLVNLPDDDDHVEFETVLNVIVSNAPSHRTAITVLKSLKKITQRVSDENPRYRVLDTQTRGVQRKLLGFEGSLDYLHLLGYKLDATQTKLQCLEHPAQYVLDRVIDEIDSLLKSERDRAANTGQQLQNKRGGGPQLQQSGAVNKLNKWSSEEKKYPDFDEDDDDDDEFVDEPLPLKLDCGDFTLAQLAALVTHETLNDPQAIRVLLLCHRCFSDSSELIKALRKRFFVPPPADAENIWNEDQIVLWCQTVQRPIQNKCIEILREWITDYFYVDFYLQPAVLGELHIFNEQVLGCKTESNDGWYESLSLILTSSIECAQQKLDITQLIEDEQMQRNKREQQEKDYKDYAQKRAEKQKKEVILPDMKAIGNLLKINYGHRKKKKKSIFVLKARRDDDDIQMLYSFSAKVIAQQITLRDFDLFCRIHSREFLDKVWKRKRRRHQQQKWMPHCVDLQKMIDRFNKMNRYIVLCIVVTKKLADRVLIIQHFIDVCRNLLELHNFFSLMAVFSALDSIPISKYKYLWLRVDDKHKSLLKNIASVCDAKSSYNTLRKLMRRSLSACAPTIPYFGVFLSDLTFVNEGASKLVEGFINFAKFERFKERCKIVEAFQKIKYGEIVETKLSQLIENDIAILNEKLSDEAQLGLLVKNGAEKDEKAATNAERQFIEEQRAKKKAKRRKNKNIKNQNKKKRANKKTI